jgi:bifunctional diaminopimelate decarboxylase / aspartate kinase
MKFGGTSVSSLQTWETIGAQLQNRLDDGFRPVLVCSALAGVSDKLEALFSGAIRGDFRAAIEPVFDRHRQVAAELGLDADELLAEDFKQLDRLARGAELVGETSPKLQARVMAFGELMSTKLGAAFLNSRGISTAWHDVRETLVSETPKDTGQTHHFLSASCCHEPDSTIQTRLAEYKQPVIITQGFIARDENNKTVLLGRGGSDTSAAYLAVILGAKRCEIWTDVPGVYSADPRSTPSARLLLRLEYKEAQEITSMGAKVLHPRCISPLAQADIPIYLKCTTRPELDGTVISGAATPGGLQVKAISAKAGITLISMESIGMWQQVGFLADVAECFKNHGVSIDLVSTSETNVTVTLDPLAGALDPDSLDALLEDLNKVSQATKIGSCASVSLVGRGIRAILHRLGPAFEVFEEAKVHLVSQAANDLNLSFVVDERQVQRLVDRLHSLLFTRVKDKTLLGPTWQEVFDKQAFDEDTDDCPWWVPKRIELVELAGKTSPLYVYDEATLDARADAVKSISSLNRVFFSIKANPHPSILKLFAAKGLGFECVSVGELEHIKATLPDLDPERILFTPNFAPKAEYVRGYELGAHVTLDNLHPLKHWPEVFAGREVFVRIDPGEGRGHHEYVKTAGAYSKFGVTLDQFETLIETAAKNDTKIVGLHAHTGSGILTPGNWLSNAKILAELAENLPDVKYLDLGGGLGVVEKPGQIPLELSQVDEGLAKVKAAFPDLELWMEPGRFLVAEAGALLVTVTQTKQKGEFRYVGVDTGFNTLLRPALYGSFHKIVNLTRLGSDAKRVEVDVVGPICETGDVLGRDRRLLDPKQGDVLLVAVTGAYGHSMSSNYNLRPPAQEIMLGDKKA